MRARHLSFLFFLTALAAYAQFPVPVGPTQPPAIPVIADPTAITESYRLLAGQWLLAASQWSSGIFFALASLDMTWLGITLWLDRHSLDTALLAATKKLIVLGFFLALVLNAGTWMPGIINGLIGLGKSASGVPSLAPSSILEMGVNIAGRMLWSATKAAAIMNVLSALGFFFGAALVFLSFLAMTAMFIVAQVQTYIAIGIASFFVAFGGSRWTVNYVERYFAYCVSAGIYLMSMYLLIGAAWPITNSWITSANKAGFAGGGLIDSWIIGAGALLYAFVVWFTAKHVSAILGGSPTLGGSDAVGFVAPIATAGIAAGTIAATAASGGAAAPVAATAAMSAGSSGAGAIAGNLGSSPTSGSGAQISPPSSGSNGGAAVQPPGSGSTAATVAKVGQIATNAVRSLPQNGHNGSGPRHDIGH